ncbi:hypothetical protein VNO78_16286 [Psophocarpus tetragonolobus]|uniref:Glutamate receptor n=1 Tax=Psophocarpus tetragonolobus TaxID=3891 RepID=A0AAN9SHM0_PSOTE
MGRSSTMSLIMCFFVLQKLAWLRVLLANERSQCSKNSIVSIGAVLDMSTLMGKHQKIAMEIAVREVNRFSCSKLDLKIRNSKGNSPQAIANAMDLAQNNQVLAIIGTITHNEAILASEFNDTMKNIPILSLIPPTTESEQLSPLLPHFIQMGIDINIHMQCMAAILGEFRWRKVTVIYELDNWFSSNPGMLLNLTYALRLVGSEIDNHLALPSLSSLSNPKSTIENELKSVKRKSNRVFLIVQSSLEWANILFEKANQMGLMQKGCVWIIPHGVAGLLDSVNSSIILNMQGVVGFKTHFMETSEAFRRFKYKFKRRFALEFPEEENINPSFFSLQSYNATKAIAQAARESQGKLTLEQLFKSIISISRKLRQPPTFNIINVIGKSYRELALWSPAVGFSTNLVTQQLTNINTNIGILSTVYWPGGIPFVPKGWTRSIENRKLKIGVPAKGVFTEFVNVAYDNKSNLSYTGFSIDVFKAAIHNLRYNLDFEFVPFNGSYDEMVEQVYNKTLDAAVGDTSIMAYRYNLVDFSQPYIESGIDMVVTEQPVKSKETWSFLEVYTKEMWLMMTALHIFVVLVMWSIERQVNEELKGLGSMLWFLVTVIFYVHGEQIKSPLARIVLAPWLFVILIASSYFTASLTSMMTVSQLEPSVVDIQTLLKRNSPVGCDGNSFIVKYLIEVQKFKHENVRNFTSINDYATAFQNKDIAAAFFISPHAKVFLAKYSCRGFTKAGNTFRLGGLGFVFPKGSTLATDISEALLKVLESGQTEQLERDMLMVGGNTSCSPLESKAKDGSTGFQPFLGLFCVCSIVAILALLYNMTCLLMNNIETTLTQLRRIWRCLTTYLTQIRSRLKSRSMRSVRTDTETRNIELMDIVFAGHAP